LIVPPCSDSMMLSMGLGKLRGKYHILNHPLPSEIKLDVL